MVLATEASGGGGGAGGPGGNASSNVGGAGGNGRQVPSTFRNPAINRSAQCILLVAAVVPFLRWNWWTGRWKC